MSRTHSVHDVISNKPETLEHHGEFIAKSKVKQGVFIEIYRGKRSPKTANEIVEKTGFRQTAVLDAGRSLVGANMATQEEVKQGNRKVIAFGKTAFCRDYRNKILGLARDPAKLKKIPTKRKVATSIEMPSVRIEVPQASFDITQITIDEIDSFKLVEDVKFDSFKLESLSETEFKEGVQKIIGEHATFKDWGGEKSDLMTTRLLLNGKRTTCAFAFKGPGLKAKLVPGKMGKNGDQCQRLFSEPADIFVVHHWREIDPSVLELMKVFAIAKSTTEMRPVKYCVIDGQDSGRLVKAYPAAFQK